MTLAVVLSYAGDKKGSIVIKGETDNHRKRKGGGEPHKSLEEGREEIGAATADYISAFIFAMMTSSC